MSTLRIELASPEEVETALEKVDPEIKDYAKKHFKRKLDTWFAWGYTIFLLVDAFLIALAIEVVVHLWKMWVM